MISHTNRKIIEEQYTGDQKSENLFFLLDNIVVSNDLTPIISSSIERIFGQSKPSYSIICDSETYKVLGQTIEHELNNFQYKTLILPSNVAATESYIDKIIEFSSPYDILIAVGSGTINDLCKYASYKQKKDYIVFGTAPSMNGYCSSNASITINGNKTTLKAHLPKAVFFDTKILSEAPQRLIASGIGDSICRSTCQVDWLFSHLIADTYYNESAFKLLEDSEFNLLKETDNKLNNKEIINNLIENLVLSGIGMHISGGSYPASQSEHMIAHYIDMFSKGNTPRTFHGEEIAVTTLHISEMQKNLLSKEKIKIQYFNYNIKDFVDKFGEEKGEYFFSEYRNKFPDKNYVDEINNRLVKNWKNIRTKLQSKCIETTRLKKALKYIKSPTSYQELYWDKEMFNEAISNSAMTRSRITFLDIYQKHPLKIG